MISSDLELTHEPDIKSTLAFEQLEIKKTSNIVDNVEIIPAEMKFMDAYEGKEFCKRLTLKNVGSKTASVRIGSPTAKIFRLKPMERFCRLSAGLSISKLIKLKFSRVFSILVAQIPIYINNSTIQYPLTIFLNQAKIVVEPQEVNFGSIDAVSTVVSRTIVVRNEGTKSTTFWIDLGRNELELIVEPTKGILEASESVTFKVELMGYFEGPFKKEFWIKTTPPKRVTVVGEFITPRIIPAYPKEHADFRIVAFPRLYIGQTASKNLIIKNLSSSNVMFCIKGVREKKYLIYEEAAKIEQNFKNFRLYPIEGRLKSQETTAIEITYRPISTGQQHAVCLIQVIRVDCTDVDDSVIFRANEMPEPTLLSSERRGSFSLSNSTTTRQVVQDCAPLEADDINIENLVTDKKLTDAESFRVCLYGDKEAVKVTIQPEIICLNQIQVDDIQIRELLLENCSLFLPITIEYLKIAFVEVWPSRFFLKPKEKKEVAVRIQSKKAGLYSSKIKFELLVYDLSDYSDKWEKVVVGHVEAKISFTALLKTTVPKTKFVTKISPDITNEVGFMTHGVQFNSKIEKPKAAVLYEDREIFRESDSGLIAFPNDRSKSLRPWTEKKL